MSQDSDSHYDFYAPWPLFGKRFSAQLGEIRQNMEELHPIVRYSATYDKDPDNIKDSRLRGWEYGNTSKHNRFRTISDTDNLWKLQANTGTEQTPYWQTALSIGEDLSINNFYLPSNIKIQTTGGGNGIISDTIIFDRANFYITTNSRGKPIINLLDDDSNYGRPIDLDDGHNRYLHVGNISFNNRDFYLSRGSIGQPVVNSLITNTTIITGATIAADDGRNQYPNISKISFANTGFYLSRGSFGQPVVNSLNIGGGASGVTDHGALTGLTPDDDHPQYLLASGTRHATGNFTFDANATVTGLLSVTGISNLDGQVLANDGFSATGISNFFGNVDVHDRVRADHFIGGGFYFADNLGEAIPGIRVREVDGTPNVYPVNDIIVSNGALTDNGKGVVTLTMSSGSGSNVTFTDGVRLFVDDTIHFNRTSFYLTNAKSSGDPVLNFKHDLTKTTQRGATWVKGGSLAVVASEAPLVQVYIPSAVTITGVEILTNGGTGSCVVDIWNKAYSGFPPTVANSITGNNKPTITSGIKYKDTTLSGWGNRQLPADSILTFKLDSTATFTFVSCTLTLQN